MTNLSVAVLGSEETSVNSTRGAGTVPAYLSVIETERRFEEYEN